MLNALLLALSLAAAPWDSLKLEDKDKARLEKGEVVVHAETYETPDGKKGRGKAYVIIKKPREVIYDQLTTGYKEFPEFMPRLEKVDVKSLTDTSMKVRSYVGVGLSTYEYTLAFKLDRAGFQTDWTLDKTADNDVKETTGQWKLHELDPGKSTLAEYTIAVDTGKFVPQFIEDYLTRKDLPQILNALRKRVESDGKWKKD